MRGDEEFPCDPATVYGATKLCAEKIFVQGNAYASQRQTRIACVRYGNVVGSRGSVVPVFREQLERNGRITITDERMTRFWITLPQAVDLVLHALDNMEGGEIFIPKIPSMRVTDGSGGGITSLKDRLSRPSRPCRWAR